MSAYWIDPSGNIARVGERHIHAVIAAPEEFGLTTAYIKKVHKKHGEPMGAEGNAREEVMRKLMNNGWIRIRYVRSGDIWTVQLDPDNSYRERVRNWAKLALRHKASPYSPVNILDMSPMTIEPVFALDEVASGALEVRRKRGMFADFLNPKKKRSA